MGEVQHPTPLPAQRATSIVCASCGEAVDPLRAERVRILQERFRYFCSEDCADGFDTTRLTPLPEPARRRPSDPQHAPLTAAHADHSYGRQQRLRALDNVHADHPPLEQDPSPTPSPPPAQVGASDAVSGPPEIEVLLVGLAVVAGTLSVALRLAGSSHATELARLVLALAATLALSAKHLMGKRDATETHPLVLLLGPLGASVLSITALVLDAPEASSTTTLTGVLVVTTAILMGLVDRARSPIDQERARILLALDHTAHRVIGEETVLVQARDLRPGEEVVIEAGEHAPADVTVSAGEARVRPWMDAATSRQVSEGDVLVAGAQVEHGRLRAVVGWAGHDRTWARLLSDPRRRADLLWPLAKTGRHAVERLAPMAAGLGALTAFAANESGVVTVMAAIAAFGAIANPVALHVGALTIGHTVLDALRRGIAYRSAEALDQVGKVHIATFCARGTLLLGEPELAHIEALGDLDQERVLALLAGAESGANHPVAVAIMRAARQRGVRPEAARSHHFEPGLGIACVAPDGQRLLVGSRALMLKERVSVASSEARIGDLETLGRSVLLVALGGRLIGVIGMQDGLRPGARAAVQYLLDTGVEPVLLSGDARETSEVLGRALDIEHVRPEILPADRGEEIRRLADGGSRIAVIGRSPADDTALTAAHVSVALASAGSTVSEWSVQLANDDVKEAAYAIRAAHDARRLAKTALALVMVPAGVGTLAMAFTLTPTVTAPLAALAGALMALLRLRTSSG